MQRALRMTGRAAIGLGIVGASIGFAATPALAASGSLTVNPNGTVTSPVVVDIAGHYDNSSSLASASLKLTITRPEGSTYTLWTGSASALSSGSTPTEHVDTTQPPWSGSVATNGTYVVHFSVGSASAAPVSVTLRIPAAPVSGFAGSASGTVAHFTWSANTEPDLAGYDIVDVSDSTRRDLTPGGVDTSVCSSGSCSVDIDFGSAASGTTRTFVIDALRYTSPSHSGTIGSSDSSPASVSFAAPATPGAGGSGGSGGAGGTSGSATGGGQTAGSTGGSTTSGGHVSGGSRASRDSISAGHAGAALRAYLPASTAGAAPDLPSVVTEVKPLQEGTYKPTLAYPDQVIGQVVHKPAGGAVGAVGSDIAQVLDIGALWKALAGAALVLLVAAHLRAWLATVDPLDR